MLFSVAPALDFDAGPRPDASARAGALQGTWGPVAVITPLPPEVSNGTDCYLDGGGSYPGESGNTVVNYTWAVYYKTGETTQILYAKKEIFRFSKLGLYIITLTVSDTAGLTGTAYTAVYAILDSDADGLPDWWEIYYFLTPGNPDLLSETGSDDPDGDGLTNLQEYANGFDPTVKDSQPGLVDELKENWYYLAILAAAIVAAILLMLPIFRRRRREDEKKRIKAAIEIEKALEEE